MWSVMMWIAASPYPDLRRLSEHAHNTGHQSLWNEVKFIDHDPYWYTRRIKESIHIRLHPNNINRDSGIVIPESRMPTIKNTTTGESYNSKPSNEQLTNIEDLNKPITAVGKKPTNHSGALYFIRKPETIRPYRLMKTSSMQSKRRDSHHKWPHRETSDNTLYLLNFTAMNKHNLFYEI